MRLYVPCMPCFVELGSPKFEFYECEVQELGLHRVRCKHGHDSLVALQLFKYEVLAEIGCNAILDGYYREAVLSFSSCLERFYEHYLRFHTRLSGIDEQSFGAFWSRIRRQSERQLGAFLAMYTIQNAGEVPQLIADERTAFRNKVAHQGYIPTKAEALAYAAAVRDFIVPVVSQMVLLNEELWRKLIHEKLEQICSQAPANAKVSTFGLSSVLDQTKNDDSSTALREHLESVWKMRQGVACLTESHNADS